MWNAGMRTEVKSAKLFLEDIHFGDHSQGVTSALRTANHCSMEIAWNISLLQN